MNWRRVLVATLVGGVAMWLAGGLIHGGIMAKTYMKYPDVFTQKQANPLYFLLVEVLIALPAACIFAKTRACWRSGVTGGLAFGFWLGFLGFFAQFFSPLVFEGFPYYLAWCWGGINMIVSLLLGVTLGAIIKS